MIRGGDSVGRGFVDEHDGFPLFSPSHLELERCVGVRVGKMGASIQRFGTHSTVAQPIFQRSQMWFIVRSVLPTTRVVEG